MRAFVGWLVARGIELASVRTSDLLAHQAELAQARKKDGKPYSVGHQQKSVSALKSFFRFLVKRSFLLQDPAASLEMPKGDARLPRVILTKDEMSKLLESVKGKTPRELRDRAILETLYATGIRAGELVALTPGDVDTDRADAARGARQGPQGAHGAAHARRLPRDRRVPRPGPRPTPAPCSRTPGSSSRIGACSAATPRSTS